MGLNPAIYLVWVVLSAMLGTFLFTHLWQFDHFASFRWNQGSQGAFKRIMTYAYLLSVPLVFTYALGLCILKYKEGIVDLPGFGIITSPYELWTPAHRAAVFPLTLFLSFSAALEVVSHSEELCFWLFVLNAGQVHKEWFESIYFKIWACCSASALIYLPLTTILTRNDLNHMEASTFFAAGLGSAMLTWAFIPVLLKFPPFLRGLRKDGVDSATIVRLTTFHELNTVRVWFRFMFTTSELLLAADGLSPAKTINRSSVATDLLGVFIGLGICISSGITLVIFFPRSIEKEISRDSSQNRGIFSQRHERRSNDLAFISQEQELYGTYYDMERRSPTDIKYNDMRSIDIDEDPAPAVPPKTWQHISPNSPAPTVLHSPYPPSSAGGFRLQPNRREPSSPVEQHSVQQATPSMLSNRPLKNPISRMAHFAESFRSPIDFRRPDAPY